MTLYEILKSKTIKWRKNNYLPAGQPGQLEFSTISEILEFNLSPETGNLRFLRKAQFEALEIYWYLRLVEGSLQIFDLYKRFYDHPVELFKSLNISISQEDLIKIMSKGGITLIFEKIKKDDNFVKKYRLEAIRETLTIISMWTWYSIIQF